MDIELFEEKKYGVVREGYEFLLKGIRLLRKSPEAFLFSLAGFFSLALVCAAFMRYFSGRMFDGPSSELSEGMFASLYPFSFSSFFLFAFLASFLTAFFQMGITAMVSARIKGKVLSFKKALRFSADRLDVLAAWAFATAVMTTVYSLLSEILSVFATFLCLLLAILWFFASFFIVPSLAFEKGNFPDIVRHSFRFLVKMIVKVFSAYFFYFLLLFCVGYVLFLFLASLTFLGGAFIFSFFFSSPFFPFFALFLALFFVFGAVLASTLDSILRLVLYREAKGKK